MINAIQTEYNGYKFRSRLEARWAVFFDAMGIKYEYEPEGYVFDDGTKYLPDFRIFVRRRCDDGKPSAVYAEVKGVMADSDKRKIELMSEHAPIIVLGNVPKDFFEYGEIYCDDDDFHSYCYIDGDNYCACFSKHLGEPWICGTDHDEWDDGISMDYALSKARKARFEWGERNG